MKFFKINLTSVIFLSVFTLLFFAPIASFASNHESGKGGELVPTPSVYERIQNPINIKTVNGLVKRILEGVIKIGIPIIALAILYCGFLFISASGKPEKIKEAKDAFLYTLIGAAVLLGAWALATLISDTVLAL